MDVHERFAEAAARARGICALPERAVDPAWDEVRSTTAFQGLVERMRLGV